MQELQIETCRNCGETDYKIINYLNEQVAECPNCRERRKAEWVHDDEGSRIEVGEELTSYCNYCWRKSDTSVKGNPREPRIPVCAKHFLDMAAENSRDHFAEEMGYSSAEEVEEEFENQEEPKITLTEAINTVNRLTDPRGDEFNEEEPVVYTDQIKRRLASKAHDKVEP